MGSLCSDDTTSKEDSTYLHELWTEFELAAASPARNLETNEEAARRKAFEKSMDPVTFSSIPETVAQLPERSPSPAPVLETDDAMLELRNNQTTWMVFNKHGVTWAPRRTEYYSE